jgi:hypothetical protein
MPPLQLFQVSTLVLFFLVVPTPVVAATSKRAWYTCPAAVSQEANAALNAAHFPCGTPEYLIDPDI